LFLEKQKSFQNGIWRDESCVVLFTEKKKMKKKKREKSGENEKKVTVSCTVFKFALGSTL
jgi:predicted nucleotidyltransferase